MIKTIQQKSAFRLLRRMVFIAALFVMAILIFAWSTQAFAAPSEKLFSSPEDAVKALTEAVKVNDKNVLDQIFGPHGKELRSGDEVQDAVEFVEFAKHLDEKSDIIKENDSKMILRIGNEGWPFPVPIVKYNDQWFFDTHAGIEETLNRRIGEDELTAILVCRAYVKAQREYVLKDWDGDGIYAYAQKLRSDHGKRNGLFWRYRPGQEMSPLGELVAQAWHQGYKKKRAAFKEAEPSPFHGYYFKILTEQGKHAPGGSYNYIINGNMVGGFALVAFPSNWGKSGVMTFIVNQQGKVYEKNLRKNTVKIAQNMKLYNPDKTWKPVKE